MGSVLAIVSKAVFEAAGGAKLSPGAVFATTRYVSANQGLAPLREGGDLYLVTVRPGDTLWLVGVLREPTFDGTAWTSAANTTPIRDLTSSIASFRFSTGKGLAAKPGALGMSLQTPRVLVDSDLTLLGGTSLPPAAAAPPAAPAAPPRPASPPPRAVGVDVVAADLLPRILATWRTTPWAVLVAASIEVSERTESPEATALRAGDKPVDDARWNGVLARGAPADLGALCATFHRAPLPSLLKRAAAISALPPDPRVAHLLHRLLQDPPFRATSSQPVWNALFDAVLRHPDPETLRVVRKVAATAFPSGAAFQTYMAKKLAAAEQKLAGAEAIVPPADVVPWWPAPSAEPPPAEVARPTARSVPPPTFPQLGAPEEVAGFSSTTARLLRRSPTGSWAAAWVADPVERTSSERLRTAALVCFDPGTGSVHTTLPLPHGTDRVFALGHTPGRVARVDGGTVRVVDPDGTERQWPVSTSTEPPTEDGERSAIAGLAFTPGDGELFVAVSERVEGSGRHQSYDGRAVLLSLRDGALTELWRCSDAPGPGDFDREETVWATATHLVWATSRVTRVWDRRWAAFSQVIEYPWASPLGESRAVATGKRNHESGWTRHDLDTGACTQHDGIVVDLSGDQALLRAGYGRGRPAGDVARHGLDGRLRQRVALAEDDEGPALLLGDAVAVCAGDQVVVHPDQRTIRWTSPRADHLATAPGVRATATGSRVHLDGPTLRRRVEEEHPVGAIALAPDGRTLYVGTTRSVRAYPLPKGKPRTMAAHAYPVTCLVVAADGTVVSGAEDNLVVVWDPGGSVRHRIADAAAPIRGLAIDPSGTRVAAVGDDGNLRVHALSSGATLETLSAPGALGPVAWLADGVGLAWLDAAGVRLRGPGGPTQVSLPSPRSLASHPDRPLLVVSTADGRLHGVLPDGATRVLSSGYRPALTALAFGPGEVLQVGGVAGGPGTVGQHPLTWVEQKEVR